MKILILLSMIISSQVFAGNCRTEVVNAYTAMGRSIESDSFSTSRFEDFRMSVYEFNRADNETQVSIYMKTKPLRVMVNETAQSLSSLISNYSQGFYAVLYADELAKMNKAKRNLVSCTL